MLDLIMLPFRFVFEIVGAVFGFIGDLVSMIFGILGGLMSLAFSLGGIILIAALIGIALRRRRPARHVNHDDDDFISYYDQNSVR